MKNLKFKLALAALVLGMGGAFATVHQHAADRKWSKNHLSGVYSDITGKQLGVDYTCSESSNVCTETYPADVDPNDNPDQIAPTSSETGDFQ